MTLDSNEQTHKKKKKKKKKKKACVYFVWARLVSFSQLGLVSDLYTYHYENMPIQI